jgi:hypothetical protein
MFLLLSPIIIKPYTFGFIRCIIVPDNDPTNQTSENRHAIFAPNSPQNGQKWPFFWKILFWNDKNTLKVLWTK